MKASRPMALPDVGEEFFMEYDVQMPPWNSDAAELRTRKSSLGEGFSSK